MPRTNRTHTMSVPPLAERDPAGILADFVSRVRYEDLPAGIVRQYKNKMLDTLAALVGGIGIKGEPVVKWLGYFRDKGGKPEARIIGYGDRLPLLGAAFVNSVASRVLDLGDMEIELDHSSEHIIPVLLSAADAVDGIDGKTFLTAFAVASEVSARIAHACYAMSEGYFKPSEIPTKLPPIQQFGVVCGVAKILGFDREQTQDAIGHAYSTLSATDAQATVEGTYMKCLEHGFTAMNSILCCELARMGIRGTRNVFCGPRGFIANFYPFKNDVAALTADLGEEWVAEVLQKRYACNMNTHSSIQAALDIVSEHGISAGQIQEVFCEIAPGAYHIISAEKWQPNTPGMARFSLPYVVANALIKGKVFVDDFSDQEINRADVCALMKRIKAGTDAKVTSFGGRVTIRTRDGRCFMKEMMEPPGSPEYPLSWEDIVQKFNLVLSSLHIGIPGSRRKEIVHTVSTIEKVGNVKSLIDLIMWRV